MDLPQHQSSILHRSVPDVAVRLLPVAGRGFACVLRIQAVVPTAAKGPVVVCLAVSRRQFRFHIPDRSVAREAAAEHAVEYWITVPFHEMGMARKSVSSVGSSNPSPT